MEKVISENRHKVSNASAQDDPTYENWLRLAETIFTGKIRVNDLLDEEEAKRRMQEIDELRARGEKTECELETRRNKKKWETEYRELTNKKIKLEVTNTKTKEKKIYNSMSEFCKNNDISRTYIRKRFKKAQSKKLLYNGLIIKKIDYDTLESKIKPCRIYLNKDYDGTKTFNTWNDEEKAFIVQHRPTFTWGFISACLGRSKESCSTMYQNIVKKDKLDFYRNLDISDKFEL